MLLRWLKVLLLEPTVSWVKSETALNLILNAETMKSRRMEVFLHSLPVLIHEEYKLCCDFLSARNLPDVTLEDFSKVDLRQFKWIHWEVGGAQSQRNTKSQTVQTNVIALDSSVSTRLLSPDQTNPGRCLFHH